MEELVFIACRRGRWQETESEGCKSARVYALWMPRDRGKLRGHVVEVPKIEQRTVEQLQVVDVLRSGEVSGRDS